MWTFTGYVKNLSVISQFMTECFTDEAFQFDALAPADITGFVERLAHDHSHSEAQLLVKALRAFLRHLQQGAFAFWERILGPHSLRILHSELRVYAARLF
jgi:hypothetical protein